MKYLLPVALIAGTVALASPVLAASDVLTLATTTSTENSGLLAYLHPDFEAKTGIRVKVIAKGTGASLQLGRDGNADVLLVHAPEQELKFVAEGYGLMRRNVMYNDFVIIGPADDPAGTRSTETAAEAFRKMPAAQATFVSRGDNSGTHIKEQTIWRKTGLPLEVEEVTVIAGGEEVKSESVRPRGDWYLSIGQGMGKTITFTTEKRGYTLADRGTYYAFSLAEPPKTDLVILSEGDPILFNPYGVIAVSPARHPEMNFDAARKYIDWITSPEVQEMIANYTVQGKTLFHPSAN